jgi:hypothetical protein
MAGTDAARRRYAELVRERGSIGSTRPFSPRLFAAFAEVPRERYLGKGPWKISRPSDPKSHPQRPPPTVRSESFTRRVYGLVQYLLECR